MLRHRSSPSQPGIRCAGAGQRHCRALSVFRPPACASAPCALVLCTLLACAPAGAQQPAPPEPAPPGPALAARAAARFPQPVRVGDLLRRQVLRPIDLTPAQLRGLPTFDGAGAQPVPPDETIRVGLAKPFH